MKNLENGLCLFHNNETNIEIRTIVSDVNSPLFCLRDICCALELKAKDVITRLDHEVVSSVPIRDNLGREQITNFINEEGLYDVILDSRKPSAHKFRKWVTKEVLPSIRKTGSYDNRMPKTLPEALRLYADKIEENEKQSKLLEAQKPKVEFFDAVADSKSAVSMNDASKVLAIKGFGRNNLFEFLRNKKILMQNNRPYQKYVDCGYFRVIEQRYMRAGEECINFKTLVYQRGLSFIKKMINKSRDCIATE